MKMKNRNRFVDDDEFEVANILLQIPHIIFESESLLPHHSPFFLANRMRNVSKKEDLLKMVDSLTHQREFLKLESEIENVKLLCSTLKALNSESKARKQQLNLDTIIAEARMEGAEQVDLQQPLPLIFCHFTQTSALVPSTMGSDVVYIIPGLDLSPSLDLNLNIALNFDTTQLKRVTAAQARKKRL
ncbi:hypothetical protein PVL29_024101 [Vitis rotundifolia]|uniref:Uncharacterized protein n=1 Tax=Vitis rotundifolia TaxID=103349 RepID=A0AA38YQU7_VITRO|nr:hypothetical protein PVL29_024101 [Vitis rotundifolia]